MSKADLKVVKSTKGEPERTREILTDAEFDRLWAERLASKQKPKPRVHRSILFERLPCIFTEVEREAMVQDMLAADIRKEEAEREMDQLKTQQKRIKERIDIEDEELRRIRKLIEAGEEDRDVKVEKSILYDDDIVAYVRTDTGEEVRSRPIRPDERQMQLVA